MPKVRKILINIVAAIFILCIPLLLLTSDIRWIANDMNFHRYGFNKYDVSQKTGISRQELGDISEGMVKYLNGEAKDSSMNIFTDNEVRHLDDVRNLIRLCYIIQWAALGYILIFSITGFIYRRTQFFHSLDMLVAAGSILSILVIATLALAAFIDFNRLFIIFHKLFFTNNLWISSGYLPHIYTEGFFSDAGTVIAITMILESLFSALIAGFCVVRRRRMMHQ